MYFPILTSMFKKNKYKRKVINKLELIIDDIDKLIEYDKEYVNECNYVVIDGEEKDEYNRDYLELQKLVNKILKIKED